MIRLHPSTAVQSDGWPVTVVDAAFLGRHERLELDLSDGTRITALSSGGFARGDTLIASIDPSQPVLVAEE